MAVRTNSQLISFSKELVDGQSLYVSSNCLPVKALKYEPAGHAFHYAALKLLGCEENDNAEVDDQNVSNDKEQVYMPSSDSYSSKGKKKSVADGKQQDHYALLGLSHLRYLATEDQIKKSYRKAELRHHPAKLASLLLAEETEAAKQSKEDEIENHFKSIQEAYEILTDPVKRRIYDSTDEFDDEIPTECAPQDFFKVFGPAFMRNGRWSVNQPIVSLGNDSTPLKDVDDFYNFWYSFKSWREFPHADEYDLEQAESRDHRWMERQNAKLSEKVRKEEYARIRTLVDNAYKRDPRILRRKEEQKAEKQRKKEAKFRAKQLQKEEAARAAEEERHRKEEEKRRAAEAALQHKKMKEKEKKLLRKERTRLRILSAPALSQHLLYLSKDDVENLCMTLDIEQLRSLCDKMEKEEGLEQANIIRDARGYDDNVEEKKRDEAHSSQLNGAMDSNGSVLLSSVEKKEKPWTKEEIELLRKGIQKYPKGTSRMWEVISEYIGTGRSVEEILKATKTVLQKPDATKAFDSFLEKRKLAQSIASPLSTREELEGVSTPSGAESSALKTVSPEDSGKTASNPVDAVSVNGVSLSSEQDVWSAVQERALVQALKTFPKATNQRWEQVAAAVTGKTVNQCKKKFALLKENFRNKKNTV